MKILWRFTHYNHNWQSQFKKNE